MPNITITNVSSEKVFIRDFYLTLAPGAVTTFYRSASDLMRSSGLHELAASGDITFYLEYTDTEKATRFDNFPGVGILTAEGGVGTRKINKTGAPSVKGTIVKNSLSADGAFQVADADCVNAIGVVYEDGVADGDECIIIVDATAEVLLKDGTAGTHGYWVKVSDVAGRADATNASAPGVVLEHFSEIGHCNQTVGSGTDVLCKCSVHFN